MRLSIEAGWRDCRTIPVTGEVLRLAFGQDRTDHPNRGCGDPQARPVLALSKRSGDGFDLAVGAEQNARLRPVIEDAHDAAPGSANDAARRVEQAI